MSIRDIYLLNVVAALGCWPNERALIGCAILLVLLMVEQMEKVSLNILSERRSKKSNSYSYAVYRTAKWFLLGLQMARKFSEIKKKLHLHLLGWSASPGPTRPGRPYSLALSLSFALNN